MVYTRTGRAFFPDRATTEAVLVRVRAAHDRGLLLGSAMRRPGRSFDAEIMPWSAKAQALIREQMPPPPLRRSRRLGHGVALLQQRAAGRDGVPADPGGALRAAQGARGEVCRRLAPLLLAGGLARRPHRIAPFHLLAADEGAVHTDKDHLLHMAEVGRPGRARRQADARHRASPRSISPTRPAWRPRPQWWERADRQRRRGHGGEAAAPSSRAGARAWCSPPSNCRGPEYLRIVYGPEYDAPEHLARLRSRGLGRKRSLAISRVPARAGGAGPLHSARSRCGACTRPCSRCWPWRASRSTRGCAWSPSWPYPIASSRVSSALAANARMLARRSASAVSR